MTPSYFCILRTVSFAALQERNGTKDVKQFIVESDTQYRSVSAYC